MTTNTPFFLAGWAFAAFFAVCAAAGVYALKYESDANRALPHAFVCFGWDGKPTTHDRDWAECRDVQIRELRHN